MATQMSKSQLIEKIATATELSKRDVKSVMLLAAYSVQFVINGIAAVRASLS